MPVAQKLDPVTLSLINAPVDDEPLTVEDLAAIAQADEAIHKGDVLSLDDVAKSLGIDLDASS